MFEKYQIYLFGWQIPFIVLFIAAWLVGGTYLLHRSVKKANIFRKPQVSRAIGCVAAAGGSALAAAAVIVILFYVLGGKLNAGDLLLPGIIVGGAVGVMVAFAMVYAFYPVKFIASVRLGAPAIGSVLLFGGLIFGAVGAVAYGKGQGSNRERLCIENLYKLDQGINYYRAKYGRAPKDLLILNEYTKHYKCPEDHANHEISYFYQPVNEQKPKYGRLVACEFKANHSGGRRAVLMYAEQRSDAKGYTPTDARIISAEEFRKLLDDPENAAFKTAFYDAHGE